MPTSSKQVIVADGLSKIYNNTLNPFWRIVAPIISFKKKAHGFFALKNLNISIARGETLGIIGRNGSGKSTLLQLICGIRRPTTGTVTVHGRISALLELGAGLHPEFSGRENIYLYGAILGFSKAETDKKFSSIVEFSGIGDFIDHPVKTYSSGMFVRLAFSIAASSEPDVLVVDEALAVGDVAFQSRCLDRLASLRAQGGTILLVSHDMLTVRNHCNRVIYLEAGQIKAQGDPETTTEAYLADMFSEHQGHNITFSRRADGRSGFCSEIGSISNVTILNASRDREFFVHLDRLKVQIHAKISRIVASPELIVQVRDRRGYLLYHTVGSSKNLHIDASCDKINIYTEVLFSIHLAPGDYSLSVFLNDRIGDRMPRMLDRMVGAAQFSVGALKHTAAFPGCVDLEAVWSPGEGIAPYCT